MVEITPDVSIEDVLQLLTAQARARWGADSTERKREMLEQAAQYVAELSNNLPNTETEPRIHQ